MRGLLILVLGSFLLAGVSYAGDTPFSFHVRVSSPPVRGTSESAMTGELVLEARRMSEGPARLDVTVERPLILGGPEQVVLDLAERGEAVGRVPLTLPPGKPEVFDFPVKVSAGGKQVLLTDVRVTKAGPWWVVGPFPGGRAEGHDRVYLPEKNVGLDLVYDGKDGRQVRFSPFPASAVRPKDGFHDLNEALGPSEKAVAYVYGVCTAPKETPCRLLIGSDDSIKVWHNGRLVHDLNQHRAAAPAQDKVDLRLVQGRNEFLLKVANDDGAWGFYLDIDDGAGKPVDGLKWQVSIGTIPLRDPELRLTEVTRTSAAFRWRSDEPAPASVQIVEAERGRRLVWDPTPREEMIQPKAGAKEAVFVATERTTQHTFKVEGLNPGTRSILFGTTVA